MTAKHRIRLDVILKIMLSISLIVAGICLMAGCISIYRSGAEQPYTREIVAQTFKAIAVPIYICLALIVITFIGASTNPNENKRNFLKPSQTQILNILAAKRDIEGSSELSSAVLRERHTRKIHTVIWSVIACLSAVCFLLYALNPANFDRADINGSMISAMAVLLPCLAATFAASLFFFYLNQKSKKREIALLKTAPLKSAAAECDNPDSQEISLKKEKKLRTLRLLLLVVFIGLAILGFILGGTADVLTKAVNICTECIGLG